ncbi:MAG: FtsW/RodA/SpoVE family cell cycle protein [Clostridiales bacterium]|nr:FtsW/RodA/SpoVE family cell cycle protein [Clostridiales bacterium]MCI6612782.1 FtsW/RodA/SpoVE family cell cycle protein [Clostridiales bacterium]
MRKILDFFTGWIRQVDLVLLALCTGTTLFGCLMIASATRYTDSYKNVIVQIAALGLGIVAYILMSMLDLNEIGKHWKWLLGGSLVLILLLKTPLGMDGGTGNRAWLGIKNFPVNLQPVEIVKITFIIVLARQLQYLQEQRDLKSIPSVGMLAGHLMLVVGLYAAISGDMGSALVLIFIFACMCFVAGVAKRWFVLGLLGGGFAFYVLWETDKISPYMKDRFLTLFDHDLDPMGIGWQQTRSLLALGGGKLTGQGLFNGTQTQSASAWSLPARHTDFIFSVIGEELGLLGCLLTILLLAAIIFHCVLIARHAQTKTDMYICIGVAAMLIFQTISNIGMCLFVMPVIGLTLPFISYGGSSIVTLFAAMGMVSGIQKRTRPEWLR